MRGGVGDVAVVAVVVAASVMMNDWVMIGIVFLVAWGAALVVIVVCLSGS